MGDLDGRLRRLAARLPEVDPLAGKMCIRLPGDPRPCYTEAEARQHGQLWIPDHDPDGETIAPLPDSLSLDDPTTGAT